MALEAIEDRKWPRTETEIHLLRSAILATQAILRDMKRDGREKEIEQISRDISKVASGLPKLTVDGGCRGISGILSLNCETGSLGRSSVN